jgi:hypothetical protein
VFQTANTLPPEDSIPPSQWSPAEQAVIRAVLGGASQQEAAKAGGLRLEEAANTYSRFSENLLLDMMRSAGRFVENALGAAGTIDHNLKILNSIGLYRSWQVDSKQPGWVHPSKQQSQKEIVQKKTETLLPAIRTALGIYRWEQIDGFEAIRRSLGIYRWEDIDDTKPGWKHPRELARRSRKDEGHPIDPVLAILNAGGIYLWDQLDASKPGWVHPSKTSQIGERIPGDQPAHEAPKSAPTAKPARPEVSPSKPAVTDFLGGKLEYLPNGQARWTNKAGETIYEGDEATIETKYYHPTTVMRRAYLAAQARFPELKKGHLAKELEQITDSLADLIEKMPIEERTDFMGSELERWIKSKNLTGEKGQLDLGL